MRNRVCDGHGQFCRWNDDEFLFVTFICWTDSKKVELSGRGYWLAYAFDEKTSLFFIHIEAIQKIKIQ